MLQNWTQRLAIGLIGLGSVAAASHPRTCVAAPVKDKPPNETAVALGDTDQWPTCVISAESFASGVPPFRRTVYILGTGECVVRELKNRNAAGDQTETRFVAEKLTAAQIAALRTALIDANPVAMRLTAKPAVPGSGFLVLRVRNGDGKEFSFACNNVIDADAENAAKVRKVFDQVGEFGKIAPNVRPAYTGAAQPDWRPFGTEAKK